MSEPTTPVSEQLTPDQTIVLPGDRLLMRYQHRLSPEVVGRMLDYFTKSMPGVTVTVVDDCEQILVYRGQAAQVAAHNAKETP